MQHHDVELSCPVALFLSCPVQLLSSKKFWKAYTECGPVYQTRSSSRLFCDSAGYLTSRIALSPEQFWDRTHELGLLPQHPLYGLLAGNSVRDPRFVEIL